MNSTLQMLDVAIGMIFTFLLLSLICTALQEFLEKFFKYRATDLERGIKELLHAQEATATTTQVSGTNTQTDSSGTQAANTGIMTALYGHSLISGLYKGSYKSTRKLDEFFCGPSYIPASNFALALLDTILPATKDNASGAAGGTLPFADPTAQQPLSLAPLRDAILTNKSGLLTNSKLKNGLLTLIDSAGNDVDKVRTNIENWYNTSMDRVSGWYKRRTQGILIFLGLILSIVVNADSIAIYRSLMSDPVLRNSVVTNAQGYLSSKTNTTNTNPNQEAKTIMETTAKELYDLRLPIGWDWDIASIDSKSNFLSNRKLALPWYYETWAKKLKPEVSLENLFTIIFSISFLGKFCGWLVTALAISLGASFWFDTLNKIMVIRSTVKPHEKSPEEDSEDRQKKSKS